MVANVVLILIIILVHISIIRYMLAHRSRCVTCPLRTHLLDEIRQSIQ